MLQVKLFGQVEILFDGKPAQMGASRSVQSLLAYLILFRDHPHPRETLADVFWTDSSSIQSRRCLNSALWRLRKLLEEGDSCAARLLRSIPGGWIALEDNCPHWFDVEIFDRQVRELTSQPLESASPAQAKALEATLELYQGELMEGFYQDWALNEREQRRQLYLSGLSYLMAYSQQSGRVNDGIRICQRILALDPLREDIHRALMRFYAASGQRGLIVQQYERCRRLLLTELNIAPMEETDQLLHALLHEGAAPLQPSSAQPQDPSLASAVIGLNQAVELFTRAQAQLQEAINKLNGLVIRDS